jgi:transmembrane sensor
VKQENWNIIAGYLSGEDLDDEELRVIEQYKTNHKEWGETVDLFNNLSDVAKMRRFDAQKAWDKLQEKHNYKTSTRRLSVSHITMKYAAAIAVLLVVPVLFWYFLTSQNQITYTTANNDNSRPVYVLSDGSKVTLNHGSTITYSKKFNNDKREIQLTGEAYFDVLPDAERPFMVVTDAAEVNVLGTSFNVNAYPGATNIEVAVSSGVVEFKSKNNSVIQLKQGEKGIFERKTNKMAIHSTFNKNDIAWVTRQIEFNATNLGKILPVLEKAHNINVKIEDDVDTTLLLTATFNQQDADYIFDVIGITLNLEIEQIEDDVYLIKNIK